MDLVQQENFNSSQDAFEYFYDFILQNGYNYQNTKAIFNTKIVLENPLNNKIYTKWRKWRLSYAEEEWNWYNDKTLNPDRVIKAGAKLWDKLKDENGNVMSNYGYWWNMHNQLDNVINELRVNPTTRQASISLLDTKIKDQNLKDIICTWGIQFYIINNKLNMSIMMRSNDLIYGFCNDQYCFSQLQKYVSNKLNLEIGIYTHFVNNLHIYKKHWSLKNDNNSNNTGKSPIVKR